MVFWSCACDISWLHCLWNPLWFEFHKSAISFTNFDTYCRLLHIFSLAILWVSLGSEIASVNQQESGVSCSSRNEVFLNFELVIFIDSPVVCHGFRCFTLLQVPDLVDGNPMDGWMRVVSITFTQANLCLTEMGTNTAMMRSTCQIWWSGAQTSHLPCG